MPLYPWIKPLMCVMKTNICYNDQEKTNVNICLHLYNLNLTVWNKMFGASVAKILTSLTSNHLPPPNPDMFLLRCPFLTEIMHQRTNEVFIHHWNDTYIVLMQCKIQQKFGFMLRITSTYSISNLRQKM
jgi:hypothetical protein